MSLQEAADHVGQLYYSLICEYLEQKRNIPSFRSEIDNDISLYFRSMDDWLAGNLEWDFMSKRYFGEEVNMIKTTRVVKIVREI